MESRRCEHEGDLVVSAEETRSFEGVGPAGCLRMPLSLVHPGETVRICRVRGDDEFSRHLATLGFVPGSYVTIVSRSAGDVIVSVKGSQLGINCTTASRIITC